MGAGWAWMWMSWCEVVRVGGRAMAMRWEGLRRIVWKDWREEEEVSGVGKYGEMRGERERRGRGGMEGRAEDRGWMGGREAGDWSRVERKGRGMMARGRGRSGGAYAKPGNKDMDGFAGCGGALGGKRGFRRRWGVRSHCYMFWGRKWKGRMLGAGRVGGARAGLPAESGGCESRHALSKSI